MSTPATAPLVGLGLIAPFSTTVLSTQHLIQMIPRGRPTHLPPPVPRQPTAPTKIMTQNKDATPNMVRMNGWLCSVIPLFLKSQCWVFFFFPYYGINFKLTCSIAMDNVCCSILIDCGNVMCMHLY